MRGSRGRSKSGCRRRKKKPPRKRKKRRSVSRRNSKGTRLRITKRDGRTRCEWLGNGGRWRTRRGRCGKLPSLRRKAGGCDKAIPCAWTGGNLATRRLGRTRPNSRLPKSKTRGSTVWTEKHSPETETQQPSLNPYSSQTLPSRVTRSRCGVSLTGSKTCCSRRTSKRLSKGEKRRRRKTPRNQARRKARRAKRRKPWRLLLLRNGRGTPGRPQGARLPRQKRWRCAPFPATKPPPPQSPVRSSRPSSPRTPARATRRRGEKPLEWHRGETRFTWWITGGAVWVVSSVWRAARANSPQHLNYKAATSRGRNCFGGTSAAPRRRCSVRRRAVC
mmetsp:Transcript_386/g.1511  ORF Transcript_386/g.1511 Transcript_386/m.1511 type:complete len:332 (+) Transcript_386:776-1771(+)